MFFPWLKMICNQIYLIPLRKLEERPFALREMPSSASQWTHNALRCKIKYNKEYFIILLLLRRFQNNFII